MVNRTSNPNAWTFFADNDIALAETIIENPRFTGEIVFHCQQAVEKYLKAFLAKNKASLIKTHDLGKLYSKVKEIKNLNLDETFLDQLATLYIESRYPTDIALLPDGSLPTQEDAKIYLNFTQKVASVIKAELEQ